MKLGLISEQSIMPDNIMVMYPEKHPRAHNGSSLYTFIPTYWKTF